MRSPCANTVAFRRGGAERDRGREPDAAPAALGIRATVSLLAIIAVCLTVALFGSRGPYLTRRVRGCRDRDHRSPQRDRHDFRAAGHYPADAAKRADRGPRIAPPAFRRCCGCWTRRRNRAREPRSSAVPTMPPLRARVCRLTGAGPVAPLHAHRRERCAGARPRIRSRHRDPPYAGRSPHRAGRG